MKNTLPQSIEKRAYKILVALTRVANPSIRLEYIKQLRLVLNDCATLQQSNCASKIEVKDGTKKRLRYLMKQINSVIDKQDPASPPECNLTPNAGSINKASGQVSCCSDVGDINSNPKPTKQETITSIESRILSEYNKYAAPHRDISWSKLAAQKIYAQHFSE